MCKLDVTVDSFLIGKIRGKIKTFMLVRVHPKFKKLLYHSLHGSKVRL